MDTNTTPTPSNTNIAGTADREPTRAPKKLPTHELWDVQDRDGRPPFWNKVGAAFENKDKSHTVLIYQPGRPDSRNLQLRAIDRDKRKPKEGQDPKRLPTHELFTVIDVEGAPNEWRRVGVAFTNKDASLSLIVDEGQRDGPKARFQLRRSSMRPSAHRRSAPAET